MSFPGKIIALLAATKVSCVLVLFLFLLTFLGTLAQMDIGLYRAQKMYFDSWWLLQPVFGYEVLPLPGGMLLMVLLSVNLVVGGIIRMRHTWSRAGILIAHIGIVMLLAAGMFKSMLAEEGGMRLLVGQSGEEYGSFNDWELVIAESMQEGGVREYLIPGEKFVHLESGGKATFRHSELGITLTLSNYLCNSEPRPAGENKELAARAIDGFYLKPLETSPENEQNAAGCIVLVRNLETGRPKRGILWGAAHYPWTVELSDRQFGLSLRKKRMTLPFSVTLRATDRELYPGTMKPKSYSSDVVITDGDVIQRSRIEMNEPLRYKGHILFQSGWGEGDPKTGAGRFSFLAVAKNPADSWPLWSCIVITLGLFIHFCLKLFLYIRFELRRMA